jgi:hypothetical protein
MQTYEQQTHVKAGLPKASISVGHGVIVNGGVDEPFDFFTVTLFPVIVGAEFLNQVLRKHQQVATNAGMEQLSPSPISSTIND